VKMKVKPILALTLCVLLSLAALPALAQTALSAADLCVNSAYAGMSMEDVKAVFGEPEAQQTDTVAATGAEQTVWSYQGLTLTFTDGTLSAAGWTNPALTGPHGLMVGDSESTVCAAFPQEDSAAASENSSERVLYAAASIEGFGLLPPYGVIRTQGAQETIVYCSPETPYTEAMKANPADTVYEVHAVLTFSLDADQQTVQSIQWSLGALAE